MTKYKKFIRVTPALVGRMRDRLVCRFCGAYLGNERWVLRIAAAGPITTAKYVCRDCYRLYYRDAEPWPE